MVVNPRAQVNTISNPVPPKEQGTGINNLFRFLLINEPPANIIAQNSTTIISPPGTGGGQGPLPLTFASQPQSMFMAVAVAAAPEELKKALDAVLVNFKPFKNYGNVLNINSALAEFGGWMNSFSAVISSKEIAEKRQSVKPLRDSDEMLLWDNLFYQALTEGTGKITDAIILMLRANAFLTELNKLNLREEITDATVTKFQQIANAFISIPSELVASPRKASPTVTPFIDAQTEKGLLQYSTIDITRFNIKSLKSYITELQGAHKLYEQQESEARTGATRAYQLEVNKIIDEQNAANPGAIEELPERNTEKSIEELQRLGIGIKLPVFSYTPADPFADDFISKNVSPQVAVVLRNYKKAADRSIQDVIGNIQVDLNGQYQTLIENRLVFSSYFNYKGMTLASSNRPANNSYVVRAECINQADSLYSIFITQYFYNANSRFKKITLKATGKNSGKTLSYISAAPIAQSENHATFQFFDNGIPMDDYDLNADYDSVDGSASGSFGQPQFQMVAPSFGNKGFTTNSFADGVPGNEDVTLYGVTKVGIGDFMRVEQQICCYVAGEVSHIENIMAREYKEKATRELTRIETVTEETTEREEERLKDNVSTERHELNSEVARVLQQDKSIQGGANASVVADFNKVTVSAAGNFNSTNSSSLNTSFKQAESYAKDVVDRAMERIVEKMTYKRTSRMLREFEETNKHGFDNRLGDHHVTGIYRWVDQVIENRVMNYGKRLMYNFVVPEPSKNFKRWMEQQYNGNNSGLGPAPLAPRSPASLGLDDWTDILRDTYAGWAAEYGVEIEACPAEGLDVGLSAGESILEATSSEAKVTLTSNFRLAGFKYEVDIPDGYYCTTAQVRFHYHKGKFYGTGHGITNAVVAVGGNQWGTNYGELALDNVTIDCWETKKLTASVSTFNVASFNLNVVGKCHLLPDIYDSWRSAAYVKILQGYQKKLQEYNDALAQYQAAVNAQQQTGQNAGTPIDYNLNPITARSIEQRELKRLCIELMLAPFGLFPMGYQVYSIGQNHYQDNVYGNANILRNADLTQHAKYVKFMEEAFDWDIIAYVLYPYYWAEEGEWSRLIKQTSSADYIFQSFLQSGMSNVVVPVRPGYETALLYFLDTGKLLQNKPIITNGVDGISNDIIAAMQLPKAIQVGDVWHTRMPTALTIIQAKSGGLDYDGLPCGIGFDDEDQASPCSDKKIATQQGDDGNLMQGADTNGTSTGTITTLPR